MKDYYNILGIRKNASHEEIRKAYRNLALKFHPDKDESHTFSEVIKDINEAKQVLLNEERRREYDSLYINEGSGHFFNKFRMATDRFKNLKRNSGQPHFIKQNTGKKIALLSSLSILFAVALVFFFKMEENEPAPRLTIYDQTNEVDNSTPKENIETALAKTDIKKNDPEIKEFKNDIQSPEPSIPEIKDDQSAKIAPGNSGKEEEKKEKRVSTLPNKPKPDNKTVAQKQEEKSEKKVTTLLAETTPGKRIEAEKKEEKRTEKQLSKKDMNEILQSINREILRLNNKSHCVQVRKTVNSNVKNGFKLADFLRSNGFIISGRETVSGTVKGTKINADNGCVKVTVGTL